MKVLELFAGTRSIGKAFEARGHEVFSVEWDKDFENINLYEDIMKVTPEIILENFGRPDVIWASPDCSSYSIAAISHHRRREETGNLAPVSEYAKFCDRVNQHVLCLILALSPRYWFIENPRGGMRKMDFMNGLPRYTVTYCQYGDTRMKPTDIWTNHPDPKFKPMCHNGDPCHVSAPRGANTGTQGLKGSKERSVIPQALCEHIAKICEEGGDIMPGVTYTIPLPPITKKNSQQIMTNRATGRPFIMPSKKYKQYEKEAAWFLKPAPPRPIECEVNIKCLFYLPTRRRTDLTNLLEAVDDLLVAAGVIADDHYGIVAAHDGSRCFWDKTNPRTEIIITKMPADEQVRMEGV